jgi:hypothetical protein
VAVVDTAAAIPAFLGMQYYGWFAFLGIWDIDVYLTGLNTLVAPVAFFRIKDNRFTGGGDIRQGIILLSHVSSFIDLIFYIFHFSSEW